MRILIVQPEIVIDATNPKKYIFSPGNEIPLNTLYLSAYLDQFNKEHMLLDLRMFRKPFKQLDKVIREYSPTIVCITACSCEIVGAHVVADRVKKWNNTVPVIIGGIHVSALPERTLRQYPAFDIIVVGEGEITLLELVNAFEQGIDGLNIPGTVVRSNGYIRHNAPRPLVDNIDIFPFPNRARVNVKKYYPNPITYNHQRLPTTGIIASRGCPYNCYHCSKGVWGKGSRYRSAKNVFLEMQQCVDEFGVRDFRFYDDVMTMKEGPLEELCHLLIDNSLKISFNCYSRIDHITPELLKLMKRAGCYHIKYGVESSSETAIRLSNRQTTPEMAQQAIANTRKAGILAKATFMMGMPGESTDDYPRTIDLACKLEPDLISYGLFTLFPGSKFHRDISSGNQELAATIPPVESVLPYISQGYKSFYFRPKFIKQHLHYILKNPDAWMYELHRFSKGFLTLIWYVIRRFFKVA